jgi:dephospho-CoA kinase
MIIGISGRMGSGKDTAAEIIRDLTSDYEIKRFAGKLKQVAQLLTGIPAEDFNRQEVKQSHLGEGWNMTVRELLQRLGTDAVRNGLHENAWVLALFADYKNQNWVIPDCRFPNEYEAIKKRGGVVVRIERGERMHNVHSSESALDAHDFDYWIDNNGSLQDLREKVEFLLYRMSNPLRRFDNATII